MYGAGATTRRGRSAASAPAVSPNRATEERKIFSCARSIGEWSEAFNSEIPPDRLSLSCNSRTRTATLARGKPGIPSERGGFLVPASAGFGMPKRNSLIFTESCGGPRIELARWPGAAPRQPKLHHDARLFVPDVKARPRSSQDHFDVRTSRARRPPCPVLGHGQGDRGGCGSSHLRDRLACVRNA